MGKPKFTLKLKPNSKARCKIKREVMTKKEEQLNKAVMWCRENNTRGWSAIKSGQFPLIKDRRTINKRLDGEIQTGEEKEYCSILTGEEEMSIVRFLKNKKRCFQGLSRHKATEVILNVLHLRKFYNRKFKGGRGFIKLSTNAKRALEKKQLGRSFWDRWDAKYPTPVRKRQGTVTVNKVVGCTREMAPSHLDELAAKLIKVKIFTDAKKSDAGVWSGSIDTRRIFNHDETPQFVNYGVDGTHMGLVYAEKGAECKKLMQENRECVSIDPFVSVSGKIAICHLIFNQKGITSQMVPPEAVKKIKNILISTTENGMQTHSSLLDAYKYFNRYLVENEIEKPVVLLSDGHSSRFDENVLRFMRENQIYLFLSPPDTTGVTQLLDQINQSLHSHYRMEKDNLFLPTQVINKEGFMEILSEIWNTWTTPAMISNAAKRVGIASTGLNINWMQVEGFEQAEECIQSEEDEENTLPSEDTPSASLVESPVGARRGSATYYKGKYLNAVKVIDGMRKDKVTLEEVPDLFQTTKLKPRVTRKKCQGYPSPWLA